MRKTIAGISLFGRQSEIQKPSDQTDATAGDPAAADNLSKEDRTMAEDDKTKGATAGADKADKADKPETAAAATAAQPAAEVVDLDKVRAETRGETLAYVNEVQDLCALAGKPDLAADFIKKNTKVADVRAALIAAKASSAGAAEISGQVGPEASGAAAATIWDRAVNKANQAVGLKR